MQELATSKRQPDQEAVKCVHSANVNGLSFTLNASEPAHSLSNTDFFLHPEISHMSSPKKMPRLMDSRSVVQRAMNASSLNSRSSTRSSRNPGEPSMWTRLRNSTQYIASFGDIRSLGSMQCCTNSRAAEDSQPTAPPTHSREARSKRAETSATFASWAFISAGRTSERVLSCTSSARSFSRGSSVECCCACCPPPYWPPPLDAAEAMSSSRFRLLVDICFNVPSYLAFGTRRSGSSNAQKHTKSSHDIPANAPPGASFVTCSSILLIAGSSALLLSSIALLVVPSSLEEPAPAIISPSSSQKKLFRRMGR
mmetsp:Transcript_1007/g.3073  ORF Transcript_1007/g.3073 Transcript_1007/m.3073 type:complete len:311 (+) Transcript_1007:530-1462(+)